MEKSVFVGIHVSKTRLDVALRPGNKNLSVTNNQSGLAALIKRLRTLQVNRVVLEASGAMQASPLVSWWRRTCRSRG